MTKPSEQIVNQNPEYSVIDARGRKIVLCRPKILEKMTFDRAVGLEMGQEFNLMYIANTSNLSYVRSIDGEPVFIPASPLAINALIQQLDYEGMEAVEEAMEKYFPKKNREGKDSKKAETELKNS